MKRLLLALVLCAPLFAQQNFFLPGFYRQQLFDTNGQPLTGGQVYTCVAGTVCPGTPQATYTDSTGTTQNSNPVVADADGVVSIWISPLMPYKFVITKAAPDNSVIQTIDNITSTGSSGSGGDTYWTLNGATISNTNGAGVGGVLIGGGLTVNAQITTKLGLIFNDNQNPSNTATITGPLCFGTETGGACAGQNVSWRLPSVDAAGCLTSDGMGNLSFQACGSGGGGSGTAGLPLNSVQVAGPSNTFLGNANFTYASTTGTVVINSASSGDAGLIVTTGGVQADNGFDAVNNASSGTVLNWNVIQTPHGGMYALGFSANSYVETGNSNGVPGSGSPAQPIPLNNSGFPHLGAMYCETSGGSTCVEKLYNGSGWVNLSTGGSGSAAGSNCQVQFNSSGNFAASGLFTWNCPATPQQLVVQAASSGVAGIAVGTGYLQADNGLYVTSGANPNWQNINVPTGGVYAKTGYFLNYVVTGSSNGNPAPFGFSAFNTSSGLGALTCNSMGGIPCVEQYWNGVAWIPWDTGGGGGSPGGGQNTIQTNVSGTFTGSVNFIYRETTGPSQNLLTLTGVTNTVALSVVNGSVQTTGASAGINLSQCTAGNCAQVPQGGVTSLTATFGGPCTIVSSVCTNGGSQQFPRALQILGTGLGGSQYAPIYFDSSSGSPLWIIGNDSTGSGANDFFITSSALTGVAVDLDHATGHIGFGGGAQTAAGHQVVIYGNVGAPALLVGGGTIQVDGGINVDGNSSQGGSLSTSITTQGGILLNASNAGSGCAVSVGNPATCIVSLTGAITTPSFTCTGSPCPGGGSGGTPVGGSFAVQYYANGTTFGGTSNVTLNPTGSTTGGAFLHIIGNSATADAAIQVDSAYIQATGFLGTGTGANNWNAIQTTGGFNANLANTGIVGAGGCAYAVAGNCLIYQDGKFDGGLVATGNSSITIGTGGNFYTRPVSSGSTGISCSGVADGWFAATTSSESITGWGAVSGTFSNVKTAVFCLGGARYRVPLVSF